MEDNNCITIKQAAALQRRQFADRLRSLRINAGFTQKQLGEKADINPALITRYENAGALPRGKAIQKLANALNVSVSDLDGRYSDTADKAKLKAFLADFGIIADFSMDGFILLNSTELLAEIKMPLHELKKILNDTEKETVAFIEPIKDTYFHTLLIRNLFEINYSVMLKKVIQLSSEDAAKYKTAKKIAKKGTPPKK